MRGHELPPNDIILDLEPYPANIICGEILQDSDEEEEERQVHQLSLFEVGSNCADCSRKILFTCSASSTGIRTLEQLLVASSVNLLCVSCAKTKKSNHGKPK